MPTKEEVLVQFAFKEQKLTWRMHTCDEATAVILYLFSQNRNRLHRETIENILMSIHKIQEDLQTQMLNMRIEKAISFPNQVNTE